MKTEQFNVGLPAGADWLRVRLGRASARGLVKLHRDDDGRMVLGIPEGDRVILLPNGNIVDAELVERIGRALDALEI